MNEEQERIAEIMREFLQHEGWMMVEQYIEDRIHDFEQQLIKMCPPEKVLEKRAVLDALHGVLRHVDELIKPTIEEVE